MANVSKSLSDPSLLAATLRGLELDKQRIEDQIKYVRSLLGKDGLRAAKKAETNIMTIASPKRRLSAEARQRIVAAQKKRWAEYRRQHGKASAKKSQ